MIVSALILFVTVLSESCLMENWCFGSINTGGSTDLFDDVVLEVYRDSSAFMQFGRVNPIDSFCEALSD